MRASRVLAAISFLVLGASAFAQVPDLNPPKQITDLSWSVGEWSGTMHWDMQGQQSDGPTTLVIDMEGQFLRQKSTQEVMGMAMTETAYMGWNEKDKRYDCWSFTNFAPTPRLEHGTVNGNTWVMESEPWDVMGQLTTGRSTVTKVSDTEMKMVLEFKMGDTWTKVSEGTLKKKPAAAK